MTASPFAAPSAPGSGITWADHNGALLVVEPLSVETGIQTSFGPSDAVRANVHVIDGPGAGDDYPDTLVFPKVLAGQLKTQIGGKVLGRLAQGVAKPGQSAPWMLQAPTEQDMQQAQQWLAARQNTVQPAAQATPPQAGTVPF